MGPLAAATVVVAVTTVGPEAAAQSQGRVVTARAGVVQQTASGAGNLAPANPVDLDFSTSGRVERLFVKRGQHVRAGRHHRGGARGWVLVGSVPEPST